MADATCDKCGEYYTDPRILPCLHTFCLQCLEQEVKTEGVKDMLQCHSCKETVTLTSNGVSDLPQDLRMAKEVEVARISKKVENETSSKCQACGRSDSGKVVAFCINCDEFLCKFCADLHGSRPTTREHTVVTAGQRLNKADESGTLVKLHQHPVACPRLHHEGCNFEFYCRRCKVLICRHCKDTDHLDHVVECHLVGKAKEEEIESLKEGCLRETQEAVRSLDGAIDDCEEMKKKIETKKKEVDAVIKDGLEKIRERLLKANDELRLGKITNLDAQLEDLQGLKEKLSHAAKLMKDSESYSAVQLLSIKETLSERAVGLKKEFEDSKHKHRPSENDVFVTALEREDIITFIVSVGRILGERSQAASSSCDAGYMPYAIVGKERTIKVIGKDEEGNPCGYGGKVEAKLVLKDSQDPAFPGKITDHGKGKYSVSVTALGPGLHELHITIANSHIKGSPFDFHVASPRESAYTELRAQQPFTTNLKPYDVAVTKEGQLAVAEFGSHTVSLYSTAGKKIHTFGNINHAGTADTQFNSPAAVAISGDLMYVCDQGNSRVLKFNISKKSFLSKFEVKGKGDKQVSSHCGICVDPEGKVFITDYSNNSIQVFRADNRFAYSFDCKSHPLGIAFDPQGLLHVVTQSSCSVHVFTPEGTPVTSYGNRRQLCRHCHQRRGLCCHQSVEERRKSLDLWPMAKQVA